MVADTTCLLQSAVVDAAYPSHQPQKGLASCGLGHSDNNSTKWSRVIIPGHGV